MTCISVTECIVITQAHDAHIYVKSKRLKHTLLLDTLIIRRKKTICQFEGMKLDHRNYLDLNESQTARMCRLVCAFDVCMQLRQVFSQHGP